MTRKQKLKKYSVSGTESGTRNVWGTVSAVNEDEALEKFTEQSSDVKVKFDKWEVEDYDISDDVEEIKTKKSKIKKVIK